MIRSVSISLPWIGTAVPLILVILTISLMVPRLLVVAHVDDLAVESRGHHHGRAHQQRPPLRASLSADEIAVRRRRGDFPAVELVGIHRQTHGTAGLAPLK